jgi:hypothetical protein
MNDDELIARFQYGLCFRTKEEVEHELALVHEQTRLVNLQADIIEDNGFENQDDVNCHHGHAGRRAYRPLTTATILQFKRRAP